MTTYEREDGGYTLPKEQRDQLTIDRNNLQDAIRQHPYQTGITVTL